MIGYKMREGLTFYHSVQRSQRGKMHHRDEDDIIFAFLRYAYKLVKEEEDGPPAFLKRGERGKRDPSVNLALGSV